MHLVSIVKLDSTISPEFYRAYCDLINETKRTENMNISVVFFAESSLYLFAQRSNPLLYLWARSRWKIRLRDMTPSLKNIAWLKLFCSMFLIIMIKKIFRWGFNNNNGCCVIICVIYGLNWPIHPTWLRTIYTRTTFSPTTFQNRVQFHSFRPRSLFQ